MARALVFGLIAALSPLAAAAQAQRLPQSPR